LAGSAVETGMHFKEQFYKSTYKCKDDIALNTKQSKKTLTILQINLHYIKCIELNSKHSKETLTIQLTSVKDIEVNSKRRKKL
jgi:hypothetical protein